MVALVAARESRADGWAARAAIEIARSWGAEGARVLLCDLALEDPELHRVAGLDNLEGVSDALLFGTSFQRLGQPLSDGLYLATAGTAVPDGEALRVHPRWRDFTAGFREAGAILALYLPADAPGVDALVALSDAAVVLAAEDESGAVEVPSRLTVLGRWGPVRAVSARSEEFTLPAEEPEESAPNEADLLLETPAPEAGDEALQDTDRLAMDGGQDQRDEPTVSEPVSSGIVADPDPPTLEEILGDDPGDPLEPGPAARAPEAAEAVGSPRVAMRPSKVETRKSARPALLVVLILVVVAVLVAGWFGYVDIPGITPAEGTVEEAGAAVPGAPVEEARGGTDAAPEMEPAPAPAPESPVAAYSVAMASYARADSALARARLLETGWPELSFVVAPVEIEGTPFFRLLAGGSPDMAAVQAVRESLSASLPGSDGWIVRESGLAFLLGSPESLALAERQVDALAAAGIPAHVLRYDDGAGATRFRVYAGAFANPGEARFMARLLEENEIENAVLTERRGVRPE